MTDRQKIGSPCSFYHEGGHGERRWIIGWRWGIIRAIRGQRTGNLQCQIELPVPLWEQQLVTRLWRRLPNVKVWIDAHNVNEPGDATYRGPDLRATVAERREAKRIEQEEADRVKEHGRRFHR